MARITTVAKARKDQGTCQKCGKDIKKGDSYKWVAVRPYGPTSSLKMKRCSDCPTWEHWELSFSKMRDIYQMQAEFDVSGFEIEDSLDSIKSALDEAAQVVRDVAEQYGESADNIEYGFGHETYQSSELREKQEALEEWANDIEEALSSMMDEPDKCEKHEGSDDDNDECEDCDEKKGEWWNEAIDTAENAINDCPV